jgi:hypothetical protein
MGQVTGYLGAMRLAVQTRRWHLGLHGLALLRNWPFGDPAVADARIDAMRRLIAGEGDPATFEVREVDVLDVGYAYTDWAATYDEPNPLIVAEETALMRILAGFPPGLAVDVAAGTGRLAHATDRRSALQHGCARDSFSICSCTPTDRGHRPPEIGRPAP